MDGAVEPDLMKAEVVDEDEVLDGPLPLAEARELERVKDAVDAVSEDTTASAWVDPGSGAITVGVTEDADLSEVGAQLDAQGVSDVRFIEVDHSRAALDEIVEGVYDQPGMENISSAMHHYESNTVVLTSRVPVTDALREAVYLNFGDAAVLASEPVSIEPSSRDADTSPFYAGAWIGRYGASSSHCTVGFSWVGETGRSFMLTAGHCYPTGSNLSVATNFGNGNHLYQMGRVIRTTVDSGGTVGADGDLALIGTRVALDGTVLNRSGSPRMFTGGTTSTTSTTVNSVDRWTAVGVDVCYSGMKRGVQCGIEVQDDGDGGFLVQDENYSYESSDGRRWNNVALATKRWGRCPIPGDSGAPVYINTPGVGVAAHGILQGSGGGGDDHYVGKYEIGGTCRMVFTEIGQAYQAFNGSVEVS